MLVVSHLHELRLLFLVFTFGVVLSLNTLAGTAQAQSGEKIYCSIISLISNPDKYHDKVVVVSGYVVIKHEGDAIYLSKNDYDNSITKNGVWIVVGDDMNELKKVQKKYAMIEGRFDASNDGHFRLFSGSIKEIIRAEDLALAKEAFGMDEIQLLP